MRSPKISILKYIRITLVIMYMSLVYATATFSAENYLGMVLTDDGLGPIKIGMTVNQISGILGVDITEVKNQYNEGDCYSYMLGENPLYFGEIRFLVNDGTLGVISVYTDKIETDRGLSTSNTLQEAETIYKGLLKKGKTHYGDIELSISYPETGTKMKVVGTEKTIHYLEIGRKPEIDFVEGCL